MKLSKEAGFSMIELMMVVVIIGVLAGVGMPQYQKFQMKAKQSEVKSLLSSMYTSQIAFKGEWNQYYADFNAVGFGLKGDLGYNVGFKGGIVGPSTHPNPAYQSTAPANNFINASRFCLQVGSCTVDKSKVGTGLPTGAMRANTNDFDFGGMANLDSDNATDQWSIDEDKQFSQIRDDITLN